MSKKEPDWQIVVIAINWYEEIDCNSGKRRRIYRNKKSTEEK